MSKIIFRIEYNIHQHKQIARLLKLLELKQKDRSSGILNMPEKDQLFWLINSLVKKELAELMVNEWSRIKEPSE